MMLAELRDALAETMASVERMTRWLSERAVRPDSVLSSAIHRRMGAFVETALMQTTRYRIEGAMQAPSSASERGPTTATAYGRALNPLHWSSANRAWLVFFLSAVVHTESLIWTLIILDEPAAHGFLNLESMRYILPITAGITIASWVLVAVMVFVRLLRPNSIAHEYACTLYYGLSLCVFSYFTGTLSMSTGVVLAGAPVLGFILFRTGPVLWSLAAALVTLATLSVGAVVGWWDYAPAIASPVGSDGALSGFWLASMSLFVAPQLAIITLLSWYGLAGWRRREEAIRQLSLTDTLTRVPNRRSIIARLEHEQQSSARTHHPLAVIMVDLDHFKSLNDELGHNVGDQALQKAGERLASALRQSDHLGRFGGEEFLLVLPGTDADGARKLAERCRAALQDEPVQLEDGEPIRLTASFGVYCNAGHWQEPPDTMLSKADEALYQAKEAGRNQVVMA